MRGLRRDAVLVLRTIRSAEQIAPARPERPPV